MPLNENLRTRPSASVSGWIPWFQPGTCNQQLGWTNEAEPNRFFKSIGNQLVTRITRFTLTPVITPLDPSIQLLRGLFGAVRALVLGQPATSRFTVVGAAEARVSFAPPHATVAQG